MLSDEERWTPTLRDDVYCSPACGFGCKRAEYEMAVRRSAEMAAELGEGWEPKIGENMHWYWQAARGRVYVHEHRDFNRSGVSVGFTAYSHSLLTGKGKTPQAAVCNLRHNIENHIEDVEQLLEDCGDGC